MIYLTGARSGKQCREMVAACPQLGMMHNSASGWRNPWTRYWALDNGVFARSPLGLRPDPDWWQRDGERLWLAVLEKAAQAQPPPLFVVLPDVVMDWPETLARAWRYRDAVEGLNLKPALALQNGFTWEDVEKFQPQALFVGGDSRFKWGRLREIVAWAKPRGVWVHVGRVNGRRPIRLAREWGADSADGTGLAMYPDAIFPEVLEGLGLPVPECQPNTGLLELMNV